MEEFSIDIQLSVLKLIKKHLEKNGSTISWLARNVDLDPKHLSGILRGANYLSENNRKRINDFLGTNY